MVEIAGFVVLLAVQGYTLFLIRRRDVYRSLSDPEVEPSHIHPAAVEAVRESLKQKPPFPKRDSWPVIREKLERGEVD